MLERPAGNGKEKLTFPSAIETIPLTVWILTLLSALILTEGYFGILFQIKADTVKYWFQRSGSLVTILGILVEISVSSRMENIKANWLSPQSFIHNMWRNDTDYRKAQADIIDTAVLATKYIPVIVIAIGTIIWGYGDMIHDLFSRINT